MIELRKITTDNYYECFKLKVKEDQNDFVANNIASLAQAWVYYESALPFAIYDNETMVGFVMLSHSKEENSYYLWRLMIGEKYQGKGYGKQTVRLVIEYCEKDPNWQGEIGVSVVPENEVATKIYLDFGFVKTGEIEDGEEVMVYKKQI